MTKQSDYTKRMKAKGYRLVSLWINPFDKPKFQHLAEKSRRVMEEQSK